MILGIHDMVDALSHYTKDHVTPDGSGWILLLDAILLIPLAFSAFFFPRAAAIGIGAALVVGLMFVGLMRVAQRHRHGVGH